MCKQLEQYKLDELIVRREVLFKALEWAISNRDKELSIVCEHELKIILKHLKRLRGY